MRAFLLDRGIDPLGRLVTLADDIIAFLREDEYYKIGPDYNDVNQQIGTFFTNMGATVNPKKQPPSHD